MYYLKGSFFFFFLGEANSAFEISDYEVHMYVSRGISVVRAFSNIKSYFWWLYYYKGVPV